MMVVDQIIIPMAAAVEELRLPVFQVEWVMILIWLLFPADLIVQADFTVVRNKQ